MIDNSRAKAKTGKKNSIFVNYNIRTKNVLVIRDGQEPKLQPLTAAVEAAQEEGLDVVQIAFDTNTHAAVCKIIDYGKFKYEQSKKEKASKKIARQNEIELKTIQLSLTTDDADKARQIQKAKEFLAEGDKVKIALRFRNRRESSNLNLAREFMKSILKEFDGIAVLDTQPGLSGRELSCIIRGASKKQ